jgi:putative peptide zinc metalloprotease protein
MSRPAPGVVPEDYCPALRSGVLLADPSYDGPRPVRLVKDTESGQSFQVGEKEGFLLARMDGTRNLADLGTAYASAYGKRLGPAHWGQLLGLLGARGLLAGAGAGAGGGAVPGGGEGAGAGAEAAAGRGPGSPVRGDGPLPRRSPGPSVSASATPRTLLRGTLPLVADADATAARLHHTLRPLLRAPVQLTLCALVVAAAALLVPRAPALLDGAWDAVRRPFWLFGVACLLWLSTALHELGHGVAARHFGGHVAEIALKWRLPVVLMYCRVDDYLYLPGRRARIITAGAGVYVNLLFLLPFAAVWRFAGPDPETADALALLLVLGTVFALAMLLPLPPLDGYRVAGQLARATGLAAASGTYVRLAVRRKAEAAAYPRPARRAYLLYPLLTLLLLAAWAVAIAAAALHLIR